jgi:hypothetical protein
MRVIGQFKKPPPAEGDTDPEHASPVAFLIVKSMLLTGFDAPAEQVMYLDRQIKEAELLQAIARVNRTAHGKNAGYVVEVLGLDQTGTGSTLVPGPGIKDSTPMAPPGNARRRRAFVASRSQTSTQGQYE